MLIRPRPTVTSNPELTAATGSGAYLPASSSTRSRIALVRRCAAATRACSRPGVPTTTSHLPPRPHGHVVPLSPPTASDPLCAGGVARARLQASSRGHGVPARTARPAMRGRRVRVKSAAVAQRTTAAARPLVERFSACARLVTNASAKQARRAKAHAWGGERALELAT